MTSQHDPRSHEPSQTPSQANGQGRNLPFDNTLILEHPLNSQHAVREAWRFISDDANADKYPIYHVEQFKRMVREAAREYGVELGHER
jgi:hypothetical protein